jgi:hypothetical protein
MEESLQESLSEINMYISKVRGEFGRRSYRMIQSQELQELSKKNKPRLGACEQQPVNPLSIATEDWNQPVHLEYPTFGAIFTTLFL